MDYYKSQDGHFVYKLYEYSGDDYWKYIEFNICDKTISFNYDYISTFECCIHIRREEFNELSNNILTDLFNVIKK